MDWLNLHTSTMDSPEFVGSDTKERGTWLSLLRYCIGQENGGTISGCKLWKDRQWQQLARVTIREVSTGCRLFSWDSESLVIWGYPKDKESEISRKREIARLNGKTGGRPKIGYETITDKEPTLVISPKAEGNGRGMEGEGNNTPLPPKGGIKEKGVLQLRAEAIFSRRHETPLTVAEVRAFSKNKDSIKSTNEDDWLILEKYYAQPQSKTFARKDLVALINNWNGEIDRAKAYFGGNSSTNEPALKFI